MIFTILIILGAYLIGSIPTGFLVARLYGIKDIRRYGSGTIGATNIARVLGKRFFVVILALDAGKAYAYLVATQSLVTMSVTMLCAVALIIGNTRSLFLNFSGGKGIATLVGIVVYISPLLCMIMALIWTFILLCTGVAGISSVIMLISVPLMRILGYWQTIDLHAMSMIVILSFWCIYLHYKNILKYVTQTG